MQDQVVNHIVERAEDGSILFLVGSGISVPAGLPTAAELLEATVQRHLPSNHPDVPKVLDLIQPEVFYEELALFLGEDAFRSLGTLASEDVEPTFAHYLIVTLAARASTPIVTTNFDCLFERASEDLGIEPIQAGPDGPFELQQGKVSIWKVHGSIVPGEPESAVSLGATMAQITAPNQRLLTALEASALGRDLCVVAYSGRDIDLYPNLRRIAPRNPVYWFDTDPDNVSIRARRANANLVRGTLETAIERIKPELLEGVRAKVPSHGSSFSSSPNRRKDLVSQAVAAGASLPEDSKHLLLATCLYRIGDAPAAAASLAARETEHLFHRDLAHRVQARIGLSQVSDALSDYCAAERHSRHAIRLAKQMGRSQRSVLSTALLLHGLHGLAMARKLQLGPVFPFEVPAVSFRVKRSRALLVLVQYIANAIRMRFLLRTIGGSEELLDQRLALWTARARNRYYDHALVLIALLEGLIGRSKLARRALRSWLMSIRRRAERIGDWRIVPHVLKQLQHFGGRGDDGIILAKHAYELTGDPLNRALIARNAGERLLKEGRLSEARTKFLEAFDSASKCGSRATGLKALVGLYACGEMIDWADARSVFAGLTGDGYERFAEAFAATVIKSN